MNHSIFNYVLVAGPHIRNHKGGVGAVIASHSRYCKPFHFIATYKVMRPVLQVIYSSWKIAWIGCYLLTHPAIKIVHLHGASGGSFYRKYIIFLMARYLFMKRVVYHVHGGGFHLFYANSSPIIKARISHFINNADAIICLSQKWKEFFTGNFNPRRIEIIPNFVETMPQATRKLNGEMVKFLFLGKVEHDKGVYDLVDAAECIKNETPHKFEVWIGGNGETKKLQELIRSRQLQDTVKFLGWISGDAKERILREANVYVLPSYAEGMPVSILEAMSYGMPVIASAVGGIPEMVKDNISGFLMKPGDKQMLQKHMEIFLSNEELIGRMGAASTTIIDSNYLPDNAIDKLRNLYVELNGDKSILSKAKA